MALPLNSTGIHNPCPLLTWTTSPEYLWALSGSRSKCWHQTPGYQGLWPAHSHSRRRKAHRWLWQYWKSVFSHKYSQRLQVQLHWWRWVIYPFNGISGDNDLEVDIHTWCTPFLILLAITWLILFRYLTNTFTLQKNPKKQLQASLIPMPQPSFPSFVVCKFVINDLMDRVSCTCMGSMWTTIDLNHVYRHEYLTYLQERSQCTNMILLLFTRLCGKEEVLRRIYVRQQSDEKVGWGPGMEILWSKVGIQRCIVLVGLNRNSCKTITFRVAKPWLHNEAHEHSM